jgi:hypothetical protein
MRSPFVLPSSSFLKFLSAVLSACPELDERCKRTKSSRPCPCAIIGMIHVSLFS